MHEFRRYIETGMDQHGWDRPELSRRSGLSRAQLHKLLTDDREHLGSMPHAATLDGLARAFGSYERVRIAAARSLVNYTDSGEPLVVDLRSVGIDALLWEIRRRVDDTPLTDDGGNEDDPTPDSPTPVDPLPTDPTTGPTTPIADEDGGEVTGDTPTADEVEVEVEPEATPPTNVRRLPHADIKPDPSRDPTEALAGLRDAADTGRPENAVQAAVREQDEDAERDAADHGGDTDGDRGGLESPL